MALRPQQSTIKPMTLGRVLQQGDLGAQRVNNVQNQLLDREAAQQDIDLNQQLNPLLVTAQQQANQIRGNTMDEAEEQRVMNSMFAGWQSIKPYLSNANPSVDDVESMQSILRNRFQEIEARGGDASDTWEMMTAIETGDFEKAKSLGAGLEAVVMGSFGGKTAATRDFETRARAAGLEPGSPEYIQAAKVELGITPRAGQSAEERIAQDETLAQQVAESKAMQAGAKEEAKLEQQMKLKPKIQGAIKEAEEAAKARGESLSELGRAEAALPGIKEVVGKLKSMVDVATYTAGGKVFDELTKQLGFGSTKGATARAKMESLLDNQILPLLKDTFGAAFTEKEGDRLRDTLLDPDAGPDAKRAQLDTFLEQKIRDLETKRRQVGNFDLEYDPATGTFK